MSKIAVFAFALYVFSLTAQAAPIAPRAAFTFSTGKCGTPQIQFKNGQFSAVDTKSFGTTTTPDIDEIVAAVCGPIDTSCGADDNAIGTCSTASSNAIQLGNTPAAADKFNTSFGFTTNFAGVAPPAAAPPAAASSAAAPPPAAASSAAAPPPAAATPPTAGAGAGRGGKNGQGRGGRGGQGRGGRGGKGGAAAPPATPPPAKGAAPPPAAPPVKGATPPPAKGATPPPAKGATPPPAKGATPPATGATPTPAKDTTKPPPAVNNAAAGAATPPPAKFAFSLGSCTNPTVTFANGKFQPANAKDFGTASSADVDEVVEAICETLNAKCKADDNSLGTCSTAASNAVQIGNLGAAADKFNTSFLVTTNFKALDAPAAGAAAPPAAPPAAPAPAPAKGGAAAAPPATPPKAATPPPAAGAGTGAAAGAKGGKQGGGRQRPQRFGGFGGRGGRKNRNN